MKTGPNHNPGCNGSGSWLSGSGYNRVRVCPCGAEDHEPEVTRTDWHDLLAPLIAHDKIDRFFAGGLAVVDPRTQAAVVDVLLGRYAGEQHDPPELPSYITGEDDRGRWFVHLLPSEVPNGQL